MRIHKNRRRSATAPDFLQDFAVRHLTETASANFFWRRRTEHADSSQSINHIPRNVRLPIDLRRIKMFIQEFAQLTERLIDFRLFRRRDPWLRHYPAANALALEEAFDETQRLRAGEQ